MVRLSGGTGSYSNSSNTTNGCQSWSYSDRANFTFHDRFPRVFITLGARSFVNGAVGGPTGSLDGSFSLTDTYHGSCSGDGPSSITCPGEVDPTQSPGGPAPLTTAAEFHYRASPRGIDVEVSPAEWGGGDSPYAMCPTYTDSWTGNNGLGGPFMLLDGRFLPGFGTAWSYTYFGARKHIPASVMHRRSFQVHIGMSSNHPAISSSDASALNECTVHAPQAQGCAISYSWHATLSFTRVCTASISFVTGRVDATDVTERQTRGRCR